MSLTDSIAKVDRLQLATSRYQNYGTLEASGLVPVRITRGAPRWKLPYRLGASVSILAPTREVFAIEDPFEFDRAYRAQLAAIGVPEIYEQLDRISREAGGRGLVLLCFEDVQILGELSCHRRTFARWWEESTDQVVPELPAVLQPLSL